MIFLLLGLVFLAACGGAHEQVILLPDAPAVLIVATPRQAQPLTQPYTTATVQQDGRVQAGTTTPEAIQARYGAVLAMLPPAGTTHTLYFASGSLRLSPESEREVAPSWHRSRPVEPVRCS